MGWVIGVATFIAVGGYTSDAVDVGGAILAFVFWFIVGFAVRIIYLNATKKAPKDPE